VRLRQREARVRSAIDEEWRQRAVPPSVDAALLTANTAVGRWSFQQSLRPLAKARNVSLITPLARSTLALVFLWYAEPTMRHEPMPLAKAQNTALVSLESWSTTVLAPRVCQGSRPQTAGRGAHVANDRRRVCRRRCCPRGDGVHLAGYQVHVVLNHVKPRRRRRQPGDPVYPDHPAPPGSKLQGVEKPPWAAMLRLGTLARLARPHVLGDLDVLAHPKGEAPYQRSCFGAPEVSPKRAVVALAEHLRPQPATGGDAESVGLALPPAVQQAAAHQERPDLRSVGGGGEGCAAPVHERAKRCRRAAHDGPENCVDGQLRRQGLDGRRRKEEVV
jgi:hypothetical protein